MNSNERQNAATFYDLDYFNWQKDMGVFGGWANSHLFRKSIANTDTVIDFGCGGGFLLDNLDCKIKFGIEPNPSAQESVKRFAIECFSSPKNAVDNLGQEIADVLISTNALEHTLNPLQEIIDLKPLLKVGGTIHFVVPCDSIHYKYNPGDLNYHLAKLGWPIFNLACLVYGRVERSWFQVELMARRV